MLTGCTPVCHENTQHIVRHLCLVIVLHICIAALSYTCIVFCEEYNTNERARQRFFQKKSKKNRVAAAINSWKIYNIPNQAFQHVSIIILFSLTALQ